MASSSNAKMTENATGSCPQFSPNATLSTAHELLAKWSDLKEREQLWSELHEAMGVLGKASAWQLPARLRLVGVVVQIVDALSNRIQAPFVSRAVQQWLDNVNNQKTLGKIDALGLLKDLGCCMEGVEAPDSAASPEKANSSDLETQVVEAARDISFHLDANALEKAVVGTVVGKDWERGRQVLDELEIISKFVAAASPSDAPQRKPAASTLPSAPAASSTQPRSPRIASAPQAREPAISHAKADASFDNNLGSSTEVAEVDAVEETLAAIMEFQDEPWPESQQSESAIEVEEAEVSVSAPPAAPALSMMPAAGMFSPAAGQKRRSVVLDDEIEDAGGFISPPRTRRLVPFEGQGSSSSSGNALFDAPLVARPAPAQQPASSSARKPQPFKFQDAEVPNAGKGTRLAWTEEEVERLIDGQERYGHRWEHIRKNCQLSHRFGTQCRDKWVNLVKAGMVHQKH